MTLRAAARPARSGAVLVEMAFVVVIFLMLLFGVLEYCRFLFVRQVVTNAAREGARYAVVHTNESTVASATMARVKTMMSGMDTNLKNYSCKVYKADSTGTNSGLPQDAQFGQYIAVEVTCDFEPVLPSFLYMNKTIKIQSKSLMYSEAN